MDLYEYQGKQLFKRFGIPVSEGRPAKTAGEARAAAEELGGPVVVKAQVLTGGRGKAGGIKLADDPADAEEKAKQILGLDIRGHVVRTLWIEQASDIEKEYYLSITFDRGVKKALFMFTTQGGMDIEEVAEKTPDALVRLHVDPLEGFQPWQARRLIYGAGVEDPNEQKQIAAIVGKLYDAFVGSDAMLCEINPLIVTPDGEVKALDSKFTVDDNALYKHPDIAEMRDIEAADPLEALAREKGVTYVKLDGEVGILGNGAGTRDVDAGRDRARRRRAGELLRPRRRRRRGGRGGRARGDHPRPAGEVDLLQHLRRDHALRRGRARHPRRSRADDDRAADRRAARRHERGGGPEGARRRGTGGAPRRGDDARRGAARGGARTMTDWSSRAEAYRNAPEHREGEDLDLIVRWAEGSRTALDVATGGGHVARRLRDAGLQVVSADPAPGMQPDVICRAEDLPFADGAFDLVVSRIAPHHFEDVAAAVAEMARVANDLVVVEDTLYVSEEVEEAEKLRDPTHVRSYSEEEWRALLEAAGLEVEQVEAFEKRHPLEAWLDRSATPDDDRRRVKELLADQIEGDEYVDTKLVLKSAEARPSGDHRRQGARSSSSRA